VHFPAAQAVLHDLRVLTAGRIGNYPYIDAPAGALAQELPAY